MLTIRTGYDRAEPLECERGVTLSNESYGYDTLNRLSNVARTDDNKSGEKLRVEC